MTKSFTVTEAQEEQLEYADGDGSENVERPTSTDDVEPSNRSRSNFSEPYKYDVQERLKETLERMRSTSFDDTLCLPSDIPNVVLNEILQCCFKKKRTFFRRTGRIMKLQVCLTNKDALIIYKTFEKESCTVSERRSNGSPKCQETQKSDTWNDSVMCTGTPSKLTLDTEPSRRSFKGSSYTRTSTSSRDITLRDPVRSIRHGKRSVASLRARIQRKLSECSTIRSLRQRQHAELSKACQVSERELLRISPLVPPMRKRKSESLMTISETSATSAPPLPINPPPSLSYSSQYISTQPEELDDAPSSHRNASYKTALTSSSNQKINNSELVSLCSTPSASSEYLEATRTALSEKSAVSKQSGKSERMSISVELKSNVVEKNPIDSAIAQKTTLEGLNTPKRPLRNTAETLMVSQTEDPRIHPNNTYQPTKIFITSTIAKEVSQPPAKSPRAVIVPFTSAKCEAPAKLEVPTIPIRPPRSRESIHFSISPYQSGDEDNSNTSKKEEVTSFSSETEEIPLDLVISTEDTETAGSITSGKRDSEYNLA